MILQQVQTARVMRAAKLVSDPQQVKAYAYGGLEAIPSRSFHLPLFAQNNLVDLHGTTCLLPVSQRATQKIKREIKSLSSDNPVPVPTAPFLFNLQAIESIGVHLVETRKDGLYPFGATHPKPHARKTPIDQTNMTCCQPCINNPLFI